MKLRELEEAVSRHSGSFKCTGRGGDRSISKTIEFSHKHEPPGPSSDVPDVGMLKEFYSTFGSLTLYFHEQSGDAAIYIGSPDEWGSLLEEFAGWIEFLDEEERHEALPQWIDYCVVVGEVPCSGNYLLVPTSGPTAGHVFLFDHDGFEFADLAPDINEFVRRHLKPDPRSLTGIASYMTFTEDGDDNQWWIEEMRDNLGHVVRTEV